MHGNFCHDDFWDLNVSWNTDVPDFTLCFQETIFVLAPCILFCIFFLYKLWHISRNRTASPLPWSALLITKMVICILLSVLSFTCFVTNVVNKIYSDEDDVSPATIISSGARSVVFTIILIVMLRNKSFGVRTSTLLCSFWLLFSFFGLIIYRSSFLRYFELVSAPHSKTMFVLDMCYFPLIFIELFLSFPKDVKNYSSLEKENPMEHETIFSYITFFWFTSVIYKGMKKQLDAEDFPPLSVKQKSRYLWERFKTKFTFTSIPTAKPDSLSNSLSVKTPSLALSLGKAFWPWLTLSLIIAMFDDLLTLIMPLFLNLIIDFVASTEHFWRGYLFCFGMALANFLNGILFNHFLFFAFAASGQIKSALTGAVYRKCLKVSNATRGEYSSGALTNLVAVDVQRVVQFALFFANCASSPLKIILTMALLWRYLGPSSLAGVAVIVLLIPFLLGATRLSEKYFEKQMAQKDTRLKYMNEILAGIKVLKLYAWELPFMDKITDTRTQEMKYTRASQFCYVAMVFVFNCAPILVAICSFATYLLVDKTHVLDPSTAFVSVNLMNILKYSLFDLPDGISELIQTNISLGRLKKFFSAEEYSEDVVGCDPKPGEVLSMVDATLSWTRDSGSEPTLQNINLHVEEGKLIAIIGPVGSGKSSLLSAVLGELYKISGSLDFKGSLAYVPQQAWILNKTVKDNILLVKPAQERVYEKIVESCCLKPDLEILPGGDKTEIGEKGVNLSGGQKQRISLARAVYQDSEVYLLDDPLSAVDAHVRKDLFENVIGNTGLLKRKTRLLVTHDISVLPNCDVIVSMKDGKIAEIGSYAELLSNCGSFTEFIQEHSNQDVEENQEDTSSKSALKRLESRDSQISKGSLDRSISTDSSTKQIQFKHVSDTGINLTEDEKMEIGKVSRGVYIKYVKHAGYLLFIPAILGALAFEAFEVGSNIWLSKWSSDSELTNSTHRFSNISYLGVYSALGFAQAFGSILGTTFLVAASVRAASLYHKDMIKSVMRSPMSFFDTTPFGRITNRFSSDMDIVDVEVVYIVDGWLRCMFGVIGIFVVIGLNIPLFLTALIPVIGIYYLIQKVYLTTSRQLKRLESVTKSPIYSHLLETIQGVSSIKAYAIEEQFTKKLEGHLDTHVLCYFHSAACNRWLSFWLYLLGCIIISAASLLAISNRGVITAAAVGLTISYAVSVTDTLIWLVRCNTDLENKSISVERVEEYCNLTPEAPWNVPERDPSPMWPAHGEIEFEEYSTRYREGLDLVLNSINVKVHSKEKVGIVGRTGAGKSSVTLALFRIIESAAGRIAIDKVDISKIGLHALRSKLTIIPQDPVLFTGSLRINLDPNNEYSDDQIWKSLEQAHLKSFVSNLSDGLSYDLTEGGENLSVGQRQLICLARALLKRTKILVLDEATAAVDMDTDRLIQNTIRTEFDQHTVITIAHRLNTIMDYDKIIVMDAGTIAEVGNPSTLLQDSESKFYHMAKDAGLI